MLGPEKFDLIRKIIYWSLELSKYDINDFTYMSIESQVLVDFSVEFSSHVGEDTPHMWILLVDKASILKGNTTIVVLEGSREILIEQLSHVEYKVSNNQVEYEILVTRMTFGKGDICFHSQSKK